MYNYILIFQVKAAFTRAYQKNSPMLPYAINSNVTARKRSLQDDDDFIEEENNEEEDDNIEFDKMIKVTLKIISTISLQERYQFYKNKYNVI